MSIYGRPVPHESYHKHKLKGQAVNTVSLATPEYLRWSESPITFHRIDHSDCIPKSKTFHIIVDPLVRMTRLTKALMDGGSGLNLMYLNTFEGLGLAQDQLKNNLHPFYKVVLGNQFEEPRSDRRGVNGSLIKSIHKNLAYIPCSTPQAKTSEIEWLKTLTNRIEMILTKL
jgi:hypothetical protein